MTTLIVTNDFPPRPGGIQTFVHGFAVRLPSVVVLTSSWRGSKEFDASLPFPVVRHPGTVLLPTPAVARLASRVAREHGVTNAWFGAAAPLGLLAPTLRREMSGRAGLGGAGLGRTGLGRTGLGRAGSGRLVASTHGHEVGWAALPGGRQALRRIGGALDAVTYLGDYTRARLAPALGSHPELVQLTGGVDVAAFRPSADGRSEVRARWGIDPGAPVVVCVSRLVERKGQAMLVRALPAWRAAVPGTRLLLVGGGPDRDRLAALAADLGVAAAVVITGSVPAGELPAHYAAGDVFAMACRSRRHGLEVEGLGLVFLEAAACGLPVVVGRSGGSVDALVDGVTGVEVDGGSLPSVRDGVLGLLRDRQRAAAMGRSGRAWVGEHFSWDVLAPRLTALLAP